MKLLKVAGATSEIWQVFIQDSSSTTGAGLAGLVFNTASLTAYYHRDTDTTATAIALVTMTSGTFTSSGFKEIDASNMPGWYQLCPPNAALASGAKSCGFLLKGATNMAPLPIEVQLGSVNPDSATAFITGINSLAPPTNWNLESIDASGRLDISKLNGSTTPVTNLANTFNGTGYSDPAAPATQSQVANIASTSAALNTTAASRTLTTGSGTGGVGNTFATDLVYDSISDTAGTIDVYYQFDVSATSGAVGVSSGWTGYVVGIVNTIKVYAYNWAGSTFDQVGTIIGISGTSNISEEWDLTSAHTGTGGNLGLVRIRFAATGLTTATIRTDRILLGYAVVLSAAQIATGVWQDTTAGDFAVASSIGKSLYTSGNAPNSAGGYVTSGTGTGQIDLDGSGRVNIGKALGTAVTLDANNVLNVSTKYVGGTIQTAGDIPARLPAALTGAGNIKADALAINGIATTSVTAVAANVGTTQPLNFTGTGASALVKIDVIDWRSNALPLPNVAGYPLVDVAKWQGDTVSAGTTAGTPDVNVKRVNNVTAATPGAAGGILIAGSNADTTFVTLTSTGAFSIGGVSNIAQTGDGYSIVNNASFGNAHLVRSTTPSNTLDVNATGGAGIDWGNVDNPTTTVGLTNTTISTGQTIANVTIGGYAAGQAPLQPTVAGRTLDVSTGGEAGLDWANIGSPTTAQVLSGTTVGTVTLVNGLAANVITAASIAADAGTELATATWSTAIPASFVSGTAGFILGNLSGGSGITQQQVADALKLAPTAGSPAAGSVYDDLNTIIAGSGGGLSGPVGFTVHTEDSLTADVPFVDFTVVGQGAGRTDSNGDFTGGLPAVGTYTINGRPTDGMLFASFTGAITAGQTITLVGTVPAITPPTDPLTAIGWVQMRDRNGAIKPGATLIYTITIGPGVDGESYDTTAGTATADINGLLEITAPCSSTLNVERGNGSEYEVVFPDTSSRFAMPEILGADIS